MVGCMISKIAINGNSMVSKISFNENSMVSKIAINENSMVSKITINGNSMVSKMAINGMCMVSKKTISKALTLEIIVWDINLVHFEQLLDPIKFLYFENRISEYVDISD